MLLSLSTGSLYVYPLRMAFRLAREAGFDGVEVAVNPEAIARGGQAVRDLAAAEDLALLSVHPVLLPIPRWREKRGGLGRTIAFARGAGAGLLVIHTPRSPTLAEGRGLAFCREIEAWQARLAGSGLRLAIENKAVHYPIERTFALTPLERLRAFADELDLGLVLDTTHAGSAGDDLLHARRIMDGRLANVHLSDLGGQVPLARATRLKTLLEEHRFPGAGTLPLAALLADLGRSGYGGPVTLEVSPVGLRAWWLPAVRRRLARAAAWMKRAISP